jgi:hypothetical protein
MIVPRARSCERHHGAPDRGVHRHVRVRPTQHRTAPSPDPPWTAPAGFVAPRGAGRCWYCAGSSTPPTSPNSPPTTRSATQPPGPPRSGRVASTMSPAAHPQRAALRHPRTGRARELPAQDHGQGATPGQFSARGPSVRSPPPPWSCSTASTIGLAVGQAHCDRVVRSVGSWTGTPAELVGGVRRVSADP